MLAVEPLGPQYCWIFAWYELGRLAHPGGHSTHIQLSKAPTLYWPVRVYQQIYFEKRTDIQAFSRNESVFCGGSL